MNASDEQLLQDLLCGDVDEHDPAIRARLAASPALQERLAALRAAEADVAALAAWSPELAGEATQQRAADDRARMAAALAPRTAGRGSGPHSTARLRRFAIIGIAAAAMLVFAIAGGDAPPTDGRLGGAGVVSLQQQQGRWSLAIAGALPPGTSYHLRLELADGTVSTATGESRTWQFPDAWNEAVARHQRGTLRIEWDDGTGLVVRHSLQLP